MERTYRTLLQWSIEYLTQAGVEQPGTDAQALLEEVVASSSEKAPPPLEREVDPNHGHRFRNWVERRAAREPLHYILGHRKFWSLDFKVTPDVLIPRPETEVLISHFLELKKNFPGQTSFRILDMCTGSGVIAIVAALEVPKSQVIAVDISNDSLAVAQENAKKHGVARKIRFLKGDLFDAIHREDLGPFDFILSNPPYIRVDRIEGLIPEIKDHEPRRTFDGGSDGLNFYHAIIPDAVRLLKKGGYVIVETGFGVHGPVCSLIRETRAFTEPAIVSDFNHYPRVVSARKK